MYLNTVIKHWPAEQTYNNRWVRAIRAAKKALGRDDITAKTEVTEDEMRLIILEIPVSSAGADKAREFIIEHDDFPEREWVRMCDAARSNIKSLKKEYQEDMDKLSQTLEYFHRQIEDLKEKNEALEKRLDQITP